MLMFARGETPDLRRFAALHDLELPDADGQGAPARDPNPVARRARFRHYPFTSKVLSPAPDRDSAQSNLTCAALVACRRI